MQSESSTKKRILSELVAARNIIKNKFRKAYTDRVKRERTIRDIMKPVLSTAEEYEKKKMGENASIENKNTTTKPSKLKPFVTPKPRQILRKSMKKRLRKATSDSDDVDVDNNEHIVQKSPNYYMMALARQTSNKFKEKTPVSTQSKNVAPRQKDQWRAGRRSNRIESVNKKRGLQQDDNEMENAWTSPISSQNRSESEDRRPSSSREVVLTRNERKQLERNQLEKGGAGISRKSKSIDFNFIPYDVNNRIIYEYFDDPNELCERLRLLVSSRMAGNTNHMQEMNSIIEELRELNFIE